MKPSMFKYRRGGKASTASLLECIPDDGCLIVFNAQHRNWRAKASTYGMFTVSKVSNAMVKRGDKELCDIIVSWKED